MARLRYMSGLASEFGAYVIVTRAWWMIPISLLLAAATMLVVVGQAAAPFTLYSLF